MRFGFLILATGLLVGCGVVNPTEARKEKCRQTIKNITEISSTDIKLEASVIQSRIEANCDFLETNKDVFREMALEHLYANIQNIENLKVRKIVVEDPDDSPADPIIDPHGFLLGVYVQEPYKDDNYSVEVAFTVSFNAEDGNWIIGWF